MRRLMPFALVVLLAACAGQGVRPSASLESSVRDSRDLADIAPVLAENGARRTLLVLDIDDTMLTSTRFFGSDAWYDWQDRTLAKGHPDKLACLFDIISLNYEAGSQRTTQPDGPSLVNALQGDRLLLTSRNPLSRGGTLRTLADAGYALPPTLPNAAAGLSWDFRKAEGARLSRVVYDQGLFMTTGQDKGLVLLDLLRRLGLQYDRVVLVDDGRKNIDNMQVALRDAGIDYVGLHYTRVDKTVDQADARAGWQAWRQLLSTTYPQRLAAIDNNQCGY